MPHQCVTCGKFYDDGSKEILQGCSVCKSKVFFFIKKSVYEQVLQEGDIDTNKKHKFYQSHLIRVKMPLKMNQAKPSEILPQESIISSPVKTDKNIPTLLEEETRITEPLPQKQKKPLVSIHSLIGATSKQTRKAVSIFRVIKKQPSSKKRLSLLRNFIS